MEASRTNSNNITNNDSREVNGSSNINSTVGPQPGNCESILADSSDNMDTSNASSNTITNIDSSEVNSSTNINSAVGPQPGNCEFIVVDPTDDMDKSNTSKNTIANINSSEVNSSSTINSEVGPQPGNCESILADLNDEMDATSASSNIDTNIDSGAVNSNSMMWFKLLLSIIGLLIYVTDFGTDIYSAVQHYLNGVYRWAGSLTVVFAVLPMCIVGIPGGFMWICSYGLLDHQGDSFVGNLPGPVACLLGIVAAPIVPIGILVWDIASIPSGRGLDKFTRIVKLFGALGSYPQASLQMYIVLQKLHGGDIIEAWQMVTTAVSIIALSFALSTSDICEEGKKPPYSSRIIWFMIGLLAITSRLVVAGVYSMIYSSLWFVPIASELVASIIVCSIKTWCPCSMCIPLDEWYSHRCSSNICYAPLTWPLTAVYNGFTVSGLVVSTINLTFAVGGFFLAFPPPIAVIALSLASVSWAANILIIVVPCFKRISKDWMIIGSDGESQLY